MKRIVLGITTLIISLIVLSSCGQKQNSIEKQFIKEFDLAVNNNDITIEELYNSYEGVPYEGISMYKIDFGSVECEDIQKWDLLPLTEDVQDFITSTSVYVDFPNVEEGNYKFINHNPNTETVKNASLCVYDKKKNIAYYLKIDT